MLKVETLIVGQLQTNCYLVYDDEFTNTNDETYEGIVIDPGDDGQYITVSLMDLNVTPVAVVATHGHFDHVLAALETKLVYKVPFMMNKADEFLLDRQQQTAEYFLGITVDPPTKIDLSLEEGNKIRVGNSYLEVISTPGHTPGSVCLVNRESKLLFVGDLIFADRTIGEANHKYSNPLQLQNSLTKLKKEFKGYSVYPGHGEIFNLQSPLNLTSKN